MKPEGTRYRAATQVKVLSPEITIVSEVDAVCRVEDSSLTGDKRGSENPTGSEAVARYQRDKLGTRETRNVPGERVWAAKPIDGKVVQLTLWESDQCIVPKKPRNGGWREGVGSSALGRKGHFLRTQRRTKEVNKTLVPNCFSSGKSTDEIYLISSSAHRGLSQRVLRGA